MLADGTIALSAATITKAVRSANARRAEKKRYNAGDGLCGVSCVAKNDGGP